MEQKEDKAKKIISSIVLIKLGIPIFIIFIVILLISGMIYYITIDDASYKEDDPKNIPYAVEQHTDNIVIYEDGNIETTTTAQELWDKMIEDGSRVEEYLDTPEELKKLINAQLITNNLDTRENPNKEIDWEKINEDTTTKEVQGIIKLKRTDKDGNTYLLKYTDPQTFQSYIDKYNETGLESDRTNAMSYYTIEKGYQPSSGGNYKVGTDGEAEIIESGDVIEIPQGQNYGTTYTYNSWQLIGAGDQLKLKEQAGMTFDNEGFGRINGRYTVATTTKFGKVGDYIDYYYIDKNGQEQIIPCIICDVKGQDAGNEWGHHGGTNILEFYVNEVTWCTPGWASGVHPWYNDCGQASSMHDNPGTSTCHPEWQGTALKVINGGSYFDNPNFVSETITSNEDENQNENDNQSENDSEISSENSNEENAPLKWPTNPSASITSYFGPRTAPTAGASSYHQGIDIGVGIGTEVYATEAGTVVNSEYKDLNGNWIKIDHGNGFESLYLHNSQLLVSVGDVVAKGQVIALSGNTGVGTGPHLHFAIKLNGNYIDPLLYKYDNGKGNGTGGFGTAVDVDQSTSGSTGSASYYAKVATWSEVTEVIESNDPEQETKNVTKVNMTSTKINYQQLVSGYQMPFDYLWALLVITEDKDFVSEIADLVYNSEIEITVYDNITKNTSVMEDNYTKSTKVITDNIVVNVEYDNNNKNEYGGPFEKEKEETYTTTTTIITTTNTLNIALTKANVWVVKYEQEFEQQAPEITSSTSSKDYEDEEYPSEDLPDKQDSVDAMGLARTFRLSIQNDYEQSYTNVTTNVESLISKYYYKTINRTINNSNTTENTKYLSTPAVIEEKTDKDADENNFVKILVKNSRARHTITGVTSWLFEILENSPDTKDMVDLTKYLLYKATDTDYGVTEFDFGIFDPKNFKELNNIYDTTSNLEGTAGQIYDFLLSKGIPPVGAAAILGNINGESGLNPSAINSSSGASGLCQWMGGRFETLQELATSKGVSWTNLEVQLEHLANEFEYDCYRDVHDVIMSATEESQLEYATWYWGRYFEVFFIDNDFESSKNKTAKRYEYAQMYYSQYLANQSSSDN